MHKRQLSFFEITLPVTHGFCESIFATIAQIAFLRIVANEQGELDVRQIFQNFVMP